MKLIVLSFLALAALLGSTTAFSLRNTGNQGGVTTTSNRNNNQIPPALVDLGIDPVPGKSKFCGTVLCDVDLARS